VAGQLAPVDPVAATQDLSVFDALVRFAALDAIAWGDVRPWVPGRRCKASYPFPPDCRRPIFNRRRRGVVAPLTAGAWIR
jgi:hypothetical protein